MTSTWWRWSAALLTAAIAFSTAAAAADWAQPAAQLARKIVAISGPGAASISYRNQSSLRPVDADSAREALERQLRSGGVRLVNAQDAATQIRITFSENTAGYLWVAEVQQGDETRVAMVRVERAASAPAPELPSSMTLHKALLWSQSQPILDVAVLSAGSEPMMLVLDPGAVTIYKQTAGKWQAQQALGIATDHPWPRDLRGRLAPAGDHLFDAYLPGMICTSGGKSNVTLSCRTGDDPWPLAQGESAFFAPTRNFFTGVLAPALGKTASVPPFYAAAALLRPTYTLWVFARTDGTVHVFDGVNDIPIRGVNWGSGVAAVRSACGTGNQLLVSGAGDETTPDTVRTFEIPDRAPSEAAAPLDFAGPVTALWPMAAGTSAVAVVHNLQASRYDAYELTITCGR